MMPREIGPEGFGKRLPALTPQDVEHLRAKWAEKGAKELRKAGYVLEADRFAVGHLTIEKQHAAAVERGDKAWADRLDRKAQKHRGPAADAMERKGNETERGNIYRDTEDRAELPALKAELAEVHREMWAIEHEAGREIQWQDAIAKAAIEKEKIERRFIEPEPARGTLAGGREKEQQQQEKHWPIMPPDTAPDKTRPGLFRTAAEEATADSRQTPPDHLKRTAGEIWVAYNRSHTPQDFAAALEEKNMRLAAATKDEADKSHREAEFAKAIGNHAPRFKEGEIVVVTEPRPEHRREGEIVEPRRVFQLNPRTTGDKAEQVEKFMAKLDRSQLQGIEATKQLLNDRAQQRRDEIDTARLDRATWIKDAAPDRAANDNLRKIIGGAVTVGRGTLGALGKVADVVGSVANVAETLVSLFDPGPPKTKEQLAELADQKRRAEAGAARDAELGRQWQRARGDDRDR